MKTLFDSYSLRDLTLPNRIVMAPMTRARAGRDGVPSDSASVYYAQRSTAGLIVSEGIQPSLLGQSSPNTPGLHSDEQVSAWKEVTQAVHANGGRIFAQIMHAGRVGHTDVTGLIPVAPSAVRADVQLFIGNGERRRPSAPRALSEKEVGAEIEVYAQAARRAVEAGFDGVELHAANGYLIQQFLSSNANQREDRYGGTISGRIRFAVEVAEATAAAIGGHRVGLRISPGGTFGDIEEHNVAELYGALLGALAPLDLAYLHTLGTSDDEALGALRSAWNSTFIVNPAFVDSERQADYSQGERWLQQGADLISFGRAFIANPDLVERFRMGASLASAHREAFYGDSDRGYIDFPSLTTSPK